ncbi:MAG TPA: hypothetical protein VJ957_00230, partial [Longimicrobiales bacterium]|nr:hypothetical protein [Longimicrobiales bacterium]
MVRYQAADTVGRERPHMTFPGWERALGLPGLRSVSLPGGWREVRLWYGFGLVIPDEFARIVQTPDTTAGRL